MKHHKRTQKTPTNNTLKNLNNTTTTTTSSLTTYEDHLKTPPYHTTPSHKNHYTPPTPTTPHTRVTYTRQGKATPSPTTPTRNNHLQHPSKNSPLAYKTRQTKAPKNTYTTHHQNTWPSRDPIEEMGGINLYAFVANDSLNWLDWLDWLGFAGWTPQPLQASSNGDPIILNNVQLAAIIYKGWKRPPMIARNAIKDGCVGMCRLYQPGNRTSIGKFRNPEDVPGTDCYLTDEEADKAMKRCLDKGGKWKAFKFAKQGVWKDGKKPVPKKEGDPIPNDSVVPDKGNDFNYATYHSGKNAAWSYMNHGMPGGWEKLLATKLHRKDQNGRLYIDPQTTTIIPSNSDLNDTGYSATQYCVTCTCDYE